MKLRSRRKEEEGSALRALPPPSQAAPRAPLPFPRLFSFPLIISALLSLHPAQPPPPPSPQLVSRHVSPSSCLSYPLPPNYSASPFLLHKITEAEERKRGGGVVLSLLAQLARPAVAAPGSPAGPCPPGGPACPPPLSFSPVSRCGPSAAGEAIGKQRSKMRFPVSFSSLTNNQTEGSRTLRCVILCC